jgi:hypothetical protein|tara:strand:- start:91 stop:726 length:636 start_codon:yes stop_codon:yes gene_type:complete
MPVNIHGKEYYTVVERLKMLKNDFKIDYSLTTDLLKCDDKVVVMKATLKIGDNVYTGHAMEKFGSNKINTSSALENAETSAIGRCLSSASYFGSEFCSANELENALVQQDEITPEQENKILKGELKEARDQADAEHPLANTIKKTMETKTIDDSADVINFGKHKGSKWSDIDEGYLKWVAKNNSKYGDIAQKHLDARQGKIVEEFEDEVPF